jgi:hypothetical protein
LLTARLGQLAVRIDAPEWLEMEILPFREDTRMGACELIWVDRLRFAEDSE